MMRPAFPQAAMPMMVLRLVAHVPMARDRTAAEHRWSRARGVLGMPGARFDLIVGWSTMALPAVDVRLRPHLSPHFASAVLPAGRPEYLSGLRFSVGPLWQAS